MAKNKLNEEYLRMHADDHFKRSTTWRDEGLTKRWKDNNDLYDSKFSKKEKEKSNALLGQGRLFIPKTFSHVHRILVDILDTFFFDPEEIVDIASWKNIPSETRDIVKTLINYRLNGHPINFYQEAYEASLDALKNKVGIFKVYPKLKTSKDEDGNEVIDKYSPVLKCLPYEDVFFAPEATWKDYYNHTIIHRFKVSMDYLKQRGYKNLDKVKVMTSDNSYDEIKQQRGFDTGSPFSSPSVKTDNSSNIMLYDVWTHLDVDGDGLLESCNYLMTGDESGPVTLIRGAERNELPYFKDGEDYNRPPIVVGSSFPEPHQLYGKSLPEITEGLQKESNAIRNQDREAVAIAIRKPILASRHANIDLMSLVNRRIGAVVLGDDISPSAIREMDTSNPSTLSQYAEARNDQNFYEATSIPPNLMGMQSSSGETATGVTSHVYNANKKIEQIIKNLAYTLFLPAFELLLRLEQTYEKDEFIELVTGRILGWGFADDNMPPSNYIQGDFDLKVNLGMNKQLQINKLLMVMDRIGVTNQSQLQLLMSGVLKPEQVHFADPMAVLHRILPLLGEKNVEEFMLESQKPPNQEGEVKGMASQTGLSKNIEAETGFTNPEGMMAEGVSGLY